MGENQGTDIHRSCQRQRNGNHLTNESTTCRYRWSMCITSRWWCSSLIQLRNQPNQSIKLRLELSTREELRRSSSREALSKTLGNAMHWRGITRSPIFSLQAMNTYDINC
jgi:hypothetical protein